MRYRSWDVLLFPLGSKIPIQEFKTRCFVTKINDGPFIHAVDYAYQGLSNQLPTMTTFIPSLPHNTPFQISIHSWDIPRPTAQIEANMGPEDSVLFETRVYIDGTFSAGSIYGQRTAWPQIVDLSSRMDPSIAYPSTKLTELDIDREGNQDSLRFPPFHTEFLQQKTWDAGDQHGRVRVVIAEGFSRPNRSPPFERYRDILAFSFQHAPIDILEQSEIAWPNPKMWLTMPGPRYMTAVAPYCSSKEHGDHGHSPNRVQPHQRVTEYPSSQTSSNTNTATLSGRSLSAYNAWAPHGEFPLPPTQWINRSHQEPRWVPQDQYSLDAGIEPFDDTAWRQRGARASCEDVPMLDYASTRSSSIRTLSSVTGFSYEHSKQPSIVGCLDEDQYNELIQSLTPTKAAPVGTRAPSNTPSTMPPPSKSATRSRRSLRSSRAVSDFSLMSLISDKASEKNLRKKASRQSQKDEQKDHETEILKEELEKVQDSQKEKEKDTLEV